MKKEILFERLRQNTHRQYDMPDIKLTGIHYDNTFQKFVDMSKQMGAQVIIANKTDDLNQIIRNIYPQAKTYASNLPYITIDHKDTDTVAEASDLNGTDVGIVSGQLGVAENGCVWIPQTMKERAVLFISEYLVILLDAQDVVDNMHQAYDRITMDDRYGYGTFISGPSKTADIEQALVMGAQAARGVTIVLLK